MNRSYVNIMTHWSNLGFFLKEAVFYIVKLGYEYSQVFG